MVWLLCASWMLDGRVGKRNREPPPPQKGPAEEDCRSDDGDPPPSDSLPRTATGRRRRVSDGETSDHDSISLTLPAVVPTRMVDLMVTFVADCLT